ncbi:Homeobox domain and Homeodomain-like-containing protein [Strongyloides ratti]|uniref:Homeobox domain and Homeodomain-like-containing protein n=1 Tax=Strongyloides ratti TaxID=34506 RepID=A0A090L2A3_STRRB|nr:Homeobox domain and Homeodomain-like-containing protein [Strongyloides ratti]CEF62202.1 Homeobox domain and Homeodomain-like-containing protein [Strongyloides ratti]
MMDSQNISIKVIIKPVLKIQNSNDTFLFEAEMDKIVVINSSTLIKNVRSEIMDKIGLHHLTSNSQVYIQFPGPKYFTFESFFPNLDVNIGVVKNLFGDALTVRISPIGDPKDFSEVEMKKTICCNLLQLLLKKYPFIKEYIENPLIHEIIESVNLSSDIKLSYQSILQLNQMIEEEIKSFKPNENELNLFLANNIIDIHNLPTPPLTINDMICKEENDTSKSSEISKDNSSSDEKNDSLLKNFFQTIPHQENMIKNIFNPPTKQHYYSRCRVSFDPVKETPLLERWYQTTKTPSFFQLQQYASHLNELSSRTTNAKITSHNIKIWFKNRRAKDNRVSKLLEAKK